MSAPQKITPFLWFDNNAEEAMNHYVSIFKNARILSLTRNGKGGWLKDKFGLSWQVVPRIFATLVQDPDPAKSQRVMQAMMQMTKMDIAALQRAHRGD